MLGEVGREVNCEDGVVPVEGSDGKVYLILLINLIRGHFKRQLHPLPNNPHPKVYLHCPRGILSLNNQNIIPKHPLIL